MWSPSAKASHRRQSSSSRWFSIIRMRNSWSCWNRSWNPWNSPLWHFFFNWLARKYSLSPGFFPYRCPWSLPFLMTNSRTERESIVFWTNFRLTSVSLCKKCPLVQKTMPVFQYDKHALHGVLDSVWTKSHSSMLPTSCIICFDSGLKRVKWLILSYICACFTTECGSPGIRKSMSASFNIIDSWLTSWSATDLSSLLRSISSSTLNVSLAWAERVWEMSDTLITSCVITGRSVRSCACSTLKSFVFRWTCLDYTRLMNGVFP